MQVNDGNDILIGGAGEDTIDGDSGTAATTDGNDVILGDDGVANLWQGGSGTDLNVTTAFGVSANLTDRVKQVVASVDMTNGHQGVDTITGTNGEEIILGGNGRDAISANVGRDVLVGDQGE